MICLALDVSDLGIHSYALILNQYFRYRWTFKTMKTFNKLFRVTLWEPVWTRVPPLVNALLKTLPPPTPVFSITMLCLHNRIPPGTHSTPSLVVFYSSLHPFPHDHPLLLQDKTKGDKLRKSSKQASMKKDKINKAWQWSTKPFSERSHGSLRRENHLIPVHSDEVNPLKSLEIPCWTLLPTPGPPCAPVLLKSMGSRMVTEEKEIKKERQWVWVSEWVSV